MCREVRHLSIAEIESVLHHRLLSHVFPFDFVPEQEAVKDDAVALLVGFLFRLVLPAVVRQLDVQSHVPTPYCRPSRLTTESVIFNVYATLAIAQATAQLATATLWPLLVTTVGKES